MTPEEWAAQPDPLVDLSRQAARAFLASEWAEVAAALREGVREAARARHPAEAEWQSAADAVAACRAAPSRERGEAVRSALVALCGGAP